MLAAETGRAAEDGDRLRQPFGHCYAQLDGERRPSRQRVDGFAQPTVRITGCRP